MSATKARGRIRAMILLKLAALALAVALLWSLFRQVPVLEGLSSAQNAVEQGGVASVILYPLGYALCNMLLLPAGVLSILGGFFFGLWWGFLLVLAGNLLGAAGAFLISRGLGRRWIESRLARSRRFRAVDRAIAREGWKVIVLSQIHPLFPTSLLNYMYGMSSMRFWPCMLWILVGQTPGLFLYAYLGTLGQYGVDMLLGGRRPAAFEAALWISGFGITLLIAWILGRIALRSLREIAGEDGEISPASSIDADAGDDKVPLA